MGGRTVTLKVKYADFDQITRSRSEPAVVSTIEEVSAAIEPALTALFPTVRTIRLLGVTLSALEPVTSNEQLQLVLAI